MYLSLGALGRTRAHIAREVFAKVRGRMTSIEWGGKGPHTNHPPYSARERTLNMLTTAATALPAHQFIHMLEEYAGFFMTSIE